jgi:TolB protein
MKIHPFTLPQSLGRLAAVFSFFLVIFSIASCGPQVTSTPTPLPPTWTATSSLSPTEVSTQTPYIITATSQNATPVPTPQGLFFLSMADSGHSHLFACSEQSLSLTRLTAGEWDDVAPSLGPSGTQLAFSSNRNGYWNLYILDLQSGLLTQLTDTPEYKGHPSWSPDGAYLAYDSLVNGNLEIMLKSSNDPSYIPNNLTQDLSADSYPAWSPLGRQVAFISNRSGEPEVWLASLNDGGVSTNVSQDPLAVESHPAWSPAGDRLAWSAVDDATGLSGIYILAVGDTGSPSHWVSSGNWPVWQDEDHLATQLSSPNQDFLAGYLTNGTLYIPPFMLPGPVDGIAYGRGVVSLPGVFESAAYGTPAPLYTIQLDPQPGVLPGRSSLVDLAGVHAVNPQLHELAVDSFEALRNRVAVLTGWDALSSLENAFVPLTTTLDPGLGEDWLYTGRAFTLNPALLDAGWMMVVREDFGQQTYWHIYLRTTAQDGSQGLPLDRVPWDFSARTGDPVAYEKGGKLMKTIPPGYWLDLTDLAVQYGWERLPALTNWRTYYAGAHFNELAFTQGLDWRSAMLQLYPQEILITPTVVIPPTRTPTRTPLYFRSPTPTRTPTIRPTNTP